MDVLPDFELIRAASIDDVLAAKKAHPDARLLGGGTDLVVNIRRGIGDDPPALIDMNDVAELKAIEADPDGLVLGASATIADVARNGAVAEYFAAVAQAAGQIAGPTHREMGTVGGNVALDTRCIFYNQSEWWRTANDYCLKYQGEMCHVAPNSKGVCFATFSGDLAPALLIYGGEVELMGASGTRTMAMPDFYIGDSRHDGSGRGDGMRYMAIEPDEFVTRVRAKAEPGLVSAYDKVRIRRSIEYPVAGCAVGLRRDGDTLADLRVAFTGTNPRPVLLEGTAALCGGTLDDDVIQGLDDLVRDQVMAMKTTFTPGHYRRRVAGALARRMTRRLWDEAA